MSIENPSSTPPADRPHASPPPEAWEPFLRLARLAGRPLERFLRIQAASGILLLVAAAGALFWANSAWSASYFALWHTPVGISLGSLRFERPLEWVVNDGLMVIFFFVVGLEIRRELDHGELSTWRRAALPAAAAVGGMLAPAGLYLLLNGTGPGRDGWGVAMATDIAFALGVLALLGERAPPALRVLLLALAVIDDLGAIVVIALFYSAGVRGGGLLVAGLGFGLVLLMQRFGVRTKLAYVPPAIVAWAGIYAAGIHPTIAGVLVGFLTPVRAWFGRAGLIANLQRQIETLALHTSDTMDAHELAGSLRKIERARREAVSPAESLIETLHPWVAFGIMPVFALANAGVQIGDGPLDPLGRQVMLGVALGLIVGKPLGIVLASWLTLRSGLGTLPRGMRLPHLVVLGAVGGVGFTMALFVAQLAFSDESLLAAAKLGVLLASGGAAVLGLALGRALLSTSAIDPRAARSADEAEGAP